MSKHNPNGVQLDRSFTDRLISVITYVVYAIFAFVCIYPFYYIFINSISANNLSERGKVIFYPMEVHFQNYANVAKIPGLMNAARISVLRTVIGTALTVIVAGFLGYMFTRQTLWKRRFWYRFVVVTMYFNAGIIPWYLTMDKLGMTNNFWGYIFPTIIQPFYIILCKTFCESVPKELQDAGEIDGAGTLRIFFSIMLPNVKNAIITVFLFSFVWNWGEYYLSKQFLGSDNRSIMTALSMLRMDLSQVSALAGVQLGTNPEKIVTRMQAGCLLTVAPMLIMFVFTQRFLADSIEHIGIK